MKILHLTLKKAPFEVMLTGEKNFEIREKGEWIKSRLFNKDGSMKHYDVVKFTNGYGSDKPYFVAVYLGSGTTFSEEPYICKFSNGFCLDLKGEYYLIDLGKIVETGNLEGVLNHG